MTQVAVDVHCDLGTGGTRGIVVYCLDVEVVVSNELRIGIDGVVTMDALGSPLSKAVGVAKVAVPYKDSSGGVETVVITDHRGLIFPVHGRATCGIDEGVVEDALVVIAIVLVIGNAIGTRIAVDMHGVVEHMQVGTVAQF